ncbi:hypothetical protein M9Y10_005160 [Tritrichomonas musculus]|uniref:Uncharacterized protein n=1 Tax=Tritrichomonas musculus TaxID=1915356 RepID=A0ABR2JM86_9EUKA
MIFFFLLSLAKSDYPTIETYEIPISGNFVISLREGSLVFINSNSYTSKNFIFSFKSDMLSNTSSTVGFSSLNISNNSSIFLSPNPGVHHIFERDLCGDFLTIIPNFKKNAKWQRKLELFKQNSNNITTNIINSSFILRFWRIPDGLCDINAYTIKANNIMSIVPRSRSFSRFCIFSSLNFSQKLHYKFNFHTTGSLLGGNILNLHESSFKQSELFSSIKTNNSNSPKLIKKSEILNKSLLYTNISTNNVTLLSLDSASSNSNDDLANFIFELFENGSSDPITMKSNVNYEIKQPFLLLGSYEDLQIGKLLLKFQADDGECLATPILKYRISQANGQSAIFNNLKVHKEKKTKINSNIPLEDQFENNIGDKQKIRCGSENERKFQIINAKNFLKSKLLLLLCKIKGAGFCNSNSDSFTFTYSTLFSPLLSTVSIGLDGWKRIDVKCIEKGNDADAGFISLVVILVGMVIFVLLHARKFVVIDDGIFNRRQEPDIVEDKIHLDIDDIESENDKIHLDIEQ